LIILIDGLAGNGIFYAAVPGWGICGLSATATCVNCKAYGLLKTIITGIPVISDNFQKAEARRSLNVRDAPPLKPGNRSAMELSFHSRKIEARIIGPDGQQLTRSIEIRKDPITGRSCRITFSRSLEKEAATDALPPRPPGADQSADCPFCSHRLEQATPRAVAGLLAKGRQRYGDSVLFPNLFPYGAYSAVSLLGDRHYVEIGTARPATYRDCFINCAEYLRKVLARDKEAVYVAITQNHLPAAGGSLVHPHLQVHADRPASNFHRFFQKRSSRFFAATGRGIFSAYLEKEMNDGRRYIGRTGQWHWLAAYAPEGFFEIWAICPGRFSMCELRAEEWHDLASGVILAQRFFRSLNRNAYNLGLLAVERPESRLELRVSLKVRANYAPWVRSDFTGYELMLGDMATFVAPEQTASRARPFWSK